MATALELVRGGGAGSGARAAHGAYHAYHPTRTLGENLKVFEALVWRDYMRRDCLALADQIRTGINSWDAWSVAMAVWRHMTAYPYLAPPAGEELYLDYSGFMARRGGDCDNKTLVQCCLMLAAGVRCRAVVIELQRANGSASGEGHMYAEALIPDRGWVAFDASRDHPMPGSPGHETHGFRRATVDFSGNRPQEANIMSVLKTSGWVPPGFIQANLLTGMLTGLMTGSNVDACGPAPSSSDPLYPSYLACVEQGRAQDARDEAAYAGSFLGRAGSIASEGILGGFTRKMREWGLAPEPTGGAADLLVPVLLGAAIIGGAIYLTR